MRFAEDYLLDCGPRILALLRGKEAVEAANVGIA